MPLPSSVDRYVITWTTNVTGANAAPQTTTLNGASVAADYAIPVTGCKSIFVQVDTLTRTSPATDMDINVIASGDGGTTFDTGTGTSIYAVHNFGTDIHESFNVTPGPTHIKFRCDENASSDAQPIVNCIVAWE